MTKAAFGAFRKDVNDADKSVLALEKSSQLLKTGLATLGVSLSGAAFAGMIKGVADAQDKLGKLSASTGIAVDTLAGLQFAAEQSGTSVERVGSRHQFFLHRTRIQRRNRQIQPPDQSAWARS